MAEYLGRWQQGEEVPLWVLCVDASGIPTDPDAAPTADIFGPSGVVAHRQLPVQEPAATVGFFQGFVFLSELYPAGRYTVELRWTTGSGAFFGASSAILEVVPGGDPSGQILAMSYYHQPQADYYVQERSSGRIYKGQNPRV